MRNRWPKRMLSTTDWCQLQRRCHAGGVHPAEAAQSKTWKEKKNPKTMRLSKLWFSQSPGGDRNHHAFCEARSASTRFLTCGLRYKMQMFPVLSNVVVRLHMIVSIGIAPRLVVDDVLDNRWMIAGTGRELPGILWVLLVRS